MAKSNEFDLWERIRATRNLATERSNASGRIAKVLETSWLSLGSSQSDSGATYSISVIERKPLNRLAHVVAPPRLQARVTQYTRACDGDGDRRTTYDAALLAGTLLEIRGSMVESDTPEDTPRLWTPHSPMSSAEATIGLQAVLAEAMFDTKAAA